jgi:hypothetical protein
LMRNVEQGRDAHCAVDVLCCAVLYAPRAAVCRQ